MSSSSARKFPWLTYIVFLAFILAFTVAPIGSVVACGWIANSHGCRVDEGSVHPCIINGVDRGPLLYTLGVMGWLMLVTFPLGGLALLAWLVILIIHRSRWQRRAAVSPPSG